MAMDEDEKDTAKVIGCTFASLGGCCMFAVAMVLVLVAGFAGVVKWMIS